MSQRLRPCHPLAVQPPRVTLGGAQERAGVGRADRCGERTAGPPVVEENPEPLDARQMRSSQGRCVPGREEVPGVLVIPTVDPYLDLRSEPPVVLDMRASLSPLAQGLP